MKTLLRKYAALFFLLPAIPIASFGQATINVVGGSFPTGQPIMGLAFGNGAYVGVGYYGNIVLSTDAVNWTTVKNSTFLNVTYSNVKFVNGLFIALSNSGSIVTSPDGTNWTIQTSGTANGLTDVVYANSKYLITGSYNTALVSTDAITWTPLAIGTASGDQLMGVSYVLGKFFIGVRAVSGNSVMYYSSTGNTGTWLTSTITTGGSLNKVVYLNNRFFALNSTPSVYTSTDGISWTVHPSSRIAASNQIFNAYYANSTYYLFGTSTEFTYFSVFTSSDGLTFALQPQTTSITVQCAAFLNGKHFASGNEGIVSSADGTTWSFISSNSNSLAYNGSRYVAVGQNTASEAAIQYSSDFSTWASAAIGVVKPLNGVTYGGGKFVAVGSLNASSLSTFAVSTDGISWTTGSTGFADLLRAVAYGNGKYVAVGLNGRILYSSNGTSWNSAENVTGANYYGVSYVNNYFVAVGGATALSGLARVKYSSDGVNWTDASPSIFGHFHSITYNAGKYVLVGRDNTSGSQKFFSMTSSNITYIPAYSGMSTVTTPEGDLGTLGYGAVAFANNKYVAVANLKVAPTNAYVLTSPDGATWTAQAAGTTSKLRALVTDASGFKSAGSTPAAFVGIGVGSILPLGLTGFTVSQSNGSTTLSWETAGEYNTSRFEIQKSTDGSSFTYIGQVTAKNSSSSNAYSFNDATATSNEVYYRLRMIDIDGKFTYSKVIRTGASAALQITLTPNPVTDYINLSVPGSLAATVQIFNEQGQTQLYKKVPAGYTRIDLNTLLKGVYVVKVQQGDKIFTSKISKQ